MKSMKGLGSMNKMLGGIRKKSSRQDSAESDAPVGVPKPGESPETTAHNTVKAFCESGSNVKGDEVLFLPPIVEAAESSPAAAAEAARIIRNFMGKSYMGRASWQYNAVMLMRILADNPGTTFTRNFDQQFVDTARSLLKHAQDRRVRQILMETLEDFQFSKMDDPNLVLIVEMWKAQKEKALREHGNQYAQGNASHRQAWASPQPNAHSQNFIHRNFTSPHQLPDAVELASRLEEARTSAKLLEQVVMNTPAGDFFRNDLISEFAGRCQTASRSIQRYMSATNPMPDNDTMETLIDTNEQLQTALNQHNRAVLSARKKGREPTTDATTAPGVNGRLREWGESNRTSPVSLTPPLSTGNPAGNGKGKQPGTYFPSSSAAEGSGSGLRAHDGDSPEDPFRDPEHETANDINGIVYGTRHYSDPFNPGFKGARGKAPFDPDFGDGNDDNIYDASPRERGPLDDS